MVLERLDAVPWGELGAAYGPAEWVPEAIRGLLDPDPDERRNALDWLDGGVFHQQGADEATPQVIPFLIELAAEPTVPDRYQLLRFLAKLIGQRSHCLFLEIAEDIPQPAREEPVAGWVLDYELMTLGVPLEMSQAPERACRANTWRDVAILERLLDDDDPEIRIAAGYVLAALITGANPAGPADPPEMTTRVVRRLGEAALREPDSRVQASHVFALGFAAPVHAEARDRLQAVETESGPGGAFGPLAEVAAWLRRLALGEALDAESGRRLAEQVLQVDLVAYLHLPWGHSSSDPEDDPSLHDLGLEIFRRVAGVADQHPEIWAFVAEVARDGPAHARANAIRLLDLRSPAPESEWAPPDLEPDADYRVRLAVIELMVEHGEAPPDRELHRAVVEAFQDGDLGDRLRAAEVLDRSPYLPVAVASAVGGERDPRVQVALCKVFGQFKNHQVVSLLRAALIGWLNQSSSPGQHEARWAVWDRLEAWAPRLAPEELAPFLRRCIEDPGCIRDRDPDRVRAVEVYRALTLWQLEKRLFLTELLRHDPDPKVRRAAVVTSHWKPVPIEGLPRLGDLLEALRDDPDERVRACIAGETLVGFLMDTGFDPALASSLVAALAQALEDDPSWHVRYQAARNLGLAAPTLEEAQQVSRRQLGRNAAEGQSAPGSELAIEALVRAVGHDRRHAVRERAGESLQKVAGAVPGLVALLRMAPPAGRSSAADALYRVGRPAALAALPDLFATLEREPDRGVRERIAHALWSLIWRDEVGNWIEPLARALWDPDPTVRTWIARTLERAGPAAAPAAEALADCLRSDDYALRRSALEALAAIGRPAESTLDAIRPYVHSPSIGLRVWALKALRAVNGERPPHLTTLLDELATLRRDRSNKARFEAMGLIGSVAAVLPGDHLQRPALVAWLHESLADHDGLVRRVAASSLGEVRPPRPESVALLRRALSDPEDYVRKAAERSLQQLGV
jgi:HEAT repeat protein